MTQELEIVNLKSRVYILEIELAEAKAQLQVVFDHFTTRDSVKWMASDARVEAMKVRPLS